MPPVFNTNIKLLKWSWNQQPELWNKSDALKQTLQPVCRSQRWTESWSLICCEVTGELSVSRILTSDLWRLHTCRPKRSFCSITMFLTVMVNLIHDWFKDLFDWSAGLRSAVSNQTQQITKVKPEVKNSLF